MKLRRFIAALLLLLLCGALFVPLSAQAEDETVADMSYTITLPWGTFEGLYSGEVVNGVPDGQGQFTSSAQLDQLTGEVISGSRSLIAVRSDNREDQATEGDSNAATEVSTESEAAAEIEEAGAAELNQESRDTTEKSESKTISKMWNYKGSFSRGTIDGEGTLTVKGGSKVSGYFASGEYIEDRTKFSSDQDAIILGDDASGFAVSELPAATITNLYGTRQGWRQDTALLTITDWHGHQEYAQSIVEMAQDLSAHNSQVVVAFNGDNDDISYSLDAWRKNPDTVTAFMNLVDQLGAINGVDMVCSLGTQELSINPLSSTSSALLASYLQALASHGAGKLHIVISDLQYATGQEMNALFEQGIVSRSVQVGGITFISAIDPAVVAADCSDSIRNSIYRWAYGSNDSLSFALNHSSLYTEENCNDPVGSLTNSLTSCLESIDPASPCVLLAYCSGTLPDTISDYYEDLLLPRRCIVVSGHTHRAMSITSVGSITTDEGLIAGPFLRVQPAALGSGSIVLYLNQETRTWDQSDGRLLMDIYSNWTRILAPVNHKTSFRLTL